MKRLCLLGLPVLLAACGAPNDENYTVMARFDPSITTVPVEQARNTARYADDTIVLSPGKYCQGFINVFGKDNATARVEFTVLSGRQFQIAGRYTYRNLVKTYNAVGNFVTRGHAVVFVDKAGAETTWAVTRADTNEIQIWGNLPMTRAACSASPLQGQALADATRLAQEEQSAPPPWIQNADNVK